jgi:hypothetical protein
MNAGRTRRQRIAAQEGFAGRQRVEVIFTVAGGALSTAATTRARLPVGGRGQGDEHSRRDRSENKNRRKHRLEAMGAGR